MMTGATAKHKGAGGNFGETIQNGLKDTKKVDELVGGFFDLFTVTDDKTMNTETVAGEEKVTLLIPEGTLHDSNSAYSGKTKISSPASVTLKWKDTTVNNQSDATKALQKANVKLQKQYEAADTQNN